MTPWVLMVGADEANACSARAALEKAGFAVEVVPTIGGGAGMPRGHEPGCAGGGWQAL